MITYSAEIRIWCPNCYIKGVVYVTDEPAFPDEERHILPFCPVCGKQFQFQDKR